MKIYTIRSPEDYDKEIEDYKFFSSKEEAKAAVKDLNDLDWEMMKGYTDWPKEKNNTYELVELECV